MKKGSLSWLRPGVRYVRGVVWGSMALAHAPTFFGAWRNYLDGGVGTSSLGGCLGLTLAMIFFAMKLRNVSFLRMRSDATSRIAILLVVALVHVDMLHPQSSDVLKGQPVNVIAISAMVGVLVSIRRSLARLLKNLFSSAKFCLCLGTLVGRIGQDFNRLRCRLLAYHLYGLRAPPS